MSRKPQEYKTYAQKMRRTNREALYTVVALVIIVVVWLIGGVGLSGLDVKVASTPVWIIGGTVGTWLVAVIIAVLFAKRIFANFDLECDDPAELMDVAAADEAANGPHTVRAASTKGGDAQ